MTIFLKGLTLCLIHICFLLTTVDNSIHGVVVGGIANFTWSWAVKNGSLCPTTLHICQPHRAISSAELKWCLFTECSDDCICWWQTQWMYYVGMDVRNLTWKYKSIIKYVIILTLNAFLGMLLTFRNNVTQLLTDHHCLFLKAVVKGDGSPDVVHTHFNSSYPETICDAAVHQPHCAMPAANTCAQLSIWLMH